jgi:hypothetical protein
MAAGPLSVINPTCLRQGLRRTAYVSARLVLDRTVSQSGQPIPKQDQRTEVMAFRFCAQACSFEPRAVGFSLPLLIVVTREAATPLATR